MPPRNHPASEVSVAWDLVRDWFATICIAACTYKTGPKMLHHDGGLDDTVKSLRELREALRPQRSLEVTVALARASSAAAHMLTPAHKWSARNLSLLDCEPSTPTAVEQNAADVQTRATQGWSVNLSMLSHECDHTLSWLLLLCVLTNQSTPNKNWAMRLARFATAPRTTAHLLQRAPSLSPSLAAS
eukprot:1617486-Pyramimonas_sp.AAC.1